MKTIETKIPSRSLKVLEFYANEFCIPATWLMESECFAEVEGLFDGQGYGGLERLDKRNPLENTEEITLSFPPGNHAFFERVAELLRRPLPELMAGFIIEAAERIADEMSSSPQISEGVPDPNLKAWAVTAMETQARARKNLPPIMGRKGEDCWTHSRISPPTTNPSAKLATYLK